MFIVLIRTHTKYNNLHEGWYNVLLKGRDAAIKIIRINYQIKTTEDLTVRFHKF